LGIVGGLVQPESNIAGLSNQVSYEITRKFACGGTNLCAEW